MPHRCKDINFVYKFIGFYEKKVEKVTKREEREVEENEYTIFINSGLFVLVCIITYR